MEFQNHLAQCPVCSELYSRITLFDQHRNDSMDSVAVEAEKRLDSWLKGFLASQSLKPPVQAAGPAPKIVPLPLTRKARTFRRMQWALAAAAMIVLAAGAIYIRGPFNAPSRAPELARTEQQSPVPLDSRSLSRPITAENQPPMNVARKHSPVLQSPTVSSHAQEPAPSVKQTEPPSAEQVPEDVARTTASAEGRPSQNASRGPLTSPTIPASQVALSPKAPMSSAVANAPKRNAATLAPTVPRRVQLSAGIRIWLSLDSKIPETEGRFQFHATLLLPVTDSGTLLLDKDTQVTGFGQTNQKQTVIQITEIVTRGRQFKLSKSSTVGSKAPGVGKAVDFREGRVFEMWLDSVSTFEATGGPSESPQK